MRIAIISGGVWHEADLATGLQLAGHSVVVINRPSVASTRPLLGKFSTFLLRLANRFPALTPASRLLYFLICKRLLIDFKPDLLIIWSSFALEWMNYTTKPVILIRGSNHILTQKSKLSTLPENLGFRREGTPNPFIVRRELEEYRKALLVSVPTVSIQSDKVWGQANVLANPYGFYPMDSFHRAKNLDNALKIAGLFLGQTSLRKGIDRLSKVVQVEPRVEISVYGPIVQPPILFEEKAISYKGNLKKDEVQKVLDSHDVLILLSREEGMARAGLEAIASGVPVLVTEATGLKLWCEKGAGVCLSDDFDERELAIGLQELCKNYSQFSLKCIEIAQSWSWANHGELLIKQFGENFKSESD